MRTTLGTLRINEALPPDLQREDRLLDKKGIHALLQEVAAKHPEDYKEILQKLNDVGRETVYNTGTSLDLESLMGNEAKEQVIGQARKDVHGFINDTTLPEEERNKRIIDALLPLGTKLTDALYDEAKKENNPYYLQVVSGSRGKKSDYNSLRGADLLTSDHTGKILPVPILHSLAEGLDPVEHFASTFAQRKGAIGVKFAVGDAGFLNKQLVNATHRLVVNKEKAPQTRLPTGLPVDPSDKANVGAVLAKDVGGITAGTLLTPDLLHKLKGSTDEILVHSPMTELSSDGGVSREAAGKRDRIDVARIGDNIGIPAAQAIGEKLSQGSLGCLVEGTMVRMADFSTSSIESIVEGDWVLGSDKEGHTFPVRVLHAFNSGVQPCVETTFKRGQKTFKTLKSTACHKMLVATNFTNHSEDCFNGKPRVLPVGKANRDLRALVPNGFTSNGPMLSEPAAYFIGLVLGDGCYTKSVHGVFLSCADPILIENAQGYLATLNLQLNKLHAYNWRFSSIEKQYHLAAGGDIVRQSSPARRILDLYEMGHKYAHEKTLPANIDRWDNASVAALIAGLIDTDGSVQLRKHNGPSRTALVEYASPSLAMLEKLRDLLEHRFGIYGSATKVATPAKRQFAKRNYYTFGISDADSIERFVRYIPLKGCKAAKLAKYHNTVPTSKKSPGGSLLRVAQVPLGPRQVFDIEVDHPDHLFVLANGLIVSNSKHLSAMAKTKGGREGFEYLNRLIQGPEELPESGPLAERDGKVTEMRAAPQGGHYITVDGHAHYAPSTVAPIVAKGDTVTAGDSLTDGIPHPADLLKHFGMGEARRRYMGLLQEALDNSNIDVHRRNLEPVVAGLLGWGKVHDPDGAGEYLPDDIASFNELAASHRPRADAKQMSPDASVGRYLEESALHHLPGALVTAKVAAHLKKHGIADVITHHEQPGFSPHFQRGVMATHDDSDPLTQLSGFYTTSAFNQSVARGQTTDPNSTSFVGALAKGQGFGDHLTTKGTYGAPAP